MASIFLAFLLMLFNKKTIEFSGRRSPEFRNKKIFEHLGTKSLRENVKDK